MELAGAFDTLGIAKIIDRAIPKTRHHNLSHSQVVKAMSINGLGFVERRPYLFPDFYEDIAVERLLGKGVRQDQLNDDVLGRTLDAIADYGPTELFNEIVAECLLPTEFGSHCIHVDTTNFSVTGEYESESNTEEIQITYGHPKDGRWDLKRFVLGIAANQHGVPLFLQTFSGNESDKETLRTIIQALVENLKSDEKVYHVADSAFYTEKNLRELGTHTFWISHAPATISRVKDLMNSNLEFTAYSDERYSYSEHQENYADISQKWVVIHSTLMHKREENTFNNNLNARAAAEKWIQPHSRYRFRDFKIIPVTRKTEKYRGRPKVGDPVVISFSISATIEYNDEAIDQERLRLGKFVLATNDPELSDNTILTYYKGQGSVEGLFRFLKDKSFRVAEIFLKKNSRIQALAMIMVLYLFIYSMTEFRLRRELTRSGETVTSQAKKQINRPTLKWVFFRFRRVREFSVVIGDRRMTKIANITDELRKILKLLGPVYENYYS